MSPHGCAFDPVLFGSEVVDPFGRYLLTTFPIADERIEGDRRVTARGFPKSRSIARRALLSGFVDVYAPAPGRQA